MFGLSKVIISNNYTLFASSIVVDFLGHLETNFISVVHPQANGQEELANKVLLSKIKKKLDINTKGIWGEQLHEIL